MLHFNNGLILAFLKEGSTVIGITETLGGLREIIISLYELKGLPMTNVHLMNKHITVRFLASVTILSLLLSAFPVTFFIALAEGEASSIELLATASAPYSVGEAIPLKLVRATALGTSSLAVGLSSTEDGQFSGG